MTRSAPERPSTREPTQKRGERRVGEILDAAAALIMETGVDVVTVQAIASRAAASKGSMYHFFRDRESVLLALVERHVEQLRAVLTAAHAELSAGSAAIDGLAVDQAVDTFVRPLAGYVREHPDLSRILAEPSVAARLARLRDALLDLVEEHAGWALARLTRPPTPERVPVIAATMGVLLGVLRNPRVVMAAGPGPTAAIAEGRRALIAYIETATE